LELNYENQSGRKAKKKRLPDTWLASNGKPLSKTTNPKKLSKKQDHEISKSSFHYFITYTQLS
jgi:hypothetical protein